MRRHQSDTGQRPGVTTDSQKLLKDFDRGNRDLRRANAILDGAAAAAIATSTGCREWPSGANHLPNNSAGSASSAFLHPRVPSAIFRALFGPSSNSPPRLGI